MFEPGQLVECVDAESRPGLGPLCAALRKGAIYTVVGPAAFPQALTHVTIAEVPNHYPPGDPGGVDYGFLADRFRPLRDERLDVFRKLVEPPPKLVHLEDELIDGILG